MFVFPPFATHDQAVARGRSMRKKTGPGIASARARIEKANANARADPSQILGTRWVVSMAVSLVRREQVRLGRIVDDFRGNSLSCERVKVLFKSSFKERV